MEDYIKKLEEEGWLEEQINNLEKVVDKLPNRKPSKPGNKSMHQHLSEKLQDMKDNPDKYIEKEAERRLADGEE